MTAQHPLLDRIKKLVLEREPSAKIYLYGSRARGTMKAHSDWDLLILLNDEKISIEKERKITDVLYDLEFEVGEVISPMVYAEKEWFGRHSITPFYSNVMKEERLL